MSDAMRLQEIIYRELNKFWLFGIFRDQTKSNDNCVILLEK